MNNLNVIKNPSGNYSFVGKVPCQLGYLTKAGNMVTSADVESQHRLPSNCRSIRPRTFCSEFEAWFEAARLGFVTVEEFTLKNPNGRM